MDKSTFIVDLNPTEYVTLAPGEAIRLFPFGKLVKGGIEREITPDLARSFKLPPWTPAVKLGSHKDETPAGAFIKGLEVREDVEEPGLYALLEVTDKGAKAIEEGDFRYHSPEVIWEDGFIEDSEGGEIQGPLILGDALLHNPHLGERAALFQSEPMEVHMTVPQKLELEVPQSFWDKLTANFSPKPEGEAPEPEKYAAVEKERDGYKAEVEQMKADTANAENMAAIQAEFNTEEFGFSFIELGKAKESAEMLARMEEDVRDWVLTNFKALSKQIDESGLTGEIGDSGADGGADPAEAFNAAVMAIQAEDPKLTYNTAMDLAKVKHAALFKAYTEK